MSKTLLMTATNTLLFLFCNQLIAFLTLFLKQPITSWTLIISLILTFCLSLISIYLIKGTLKIYLISNISFFILFIISVLFSRLWIENSFDGWAYQGEAILQLIKGWNPIYTLQSQDFNKHTHNFWLDVYPKMSWYQSTMMYKITNNYNDIKYVSILLIFISSIFVWQACDFLLKSVNNKRLWKALITFITCITPITLTQSITIGLDGQMSALLAILLALIIMIYNNKKITDYLHCNCLYLLYLNLALVLFLLIGLKTAGLIYGIIFISIGIIYLLLTNIDFTIIKNLLTVTGLTIIFSLSLNFNPYILNFLNHNNFLYPAIGEKSYIYAENTPSNYRDKDSIEIFLASNFFKTSRVFVDSDPLESAQLKIPFTVESNELESISKSSHLKKGGFGPLYGALFITSIIIVISIYYKSLLSKKDIQELIGVAQIKAKNQHEDRIFKVFSLTYFILTLILITLLTKTSNTYRYVPYLWFILPAILIVCLHFKEVLFRVSSIFLAGLILLNISIVGYYYFSYQIHVTNTYEKRLNFLSQNVNQDNTNNKPIQINFGLQIALRDLLDRKQIKYTTDEIYPNCQNFIDREEFLPLTQITACLDGMSESSIKEFKAIEVDKKI
jgi:hypothetical protein